jgi:PIN domain nuclease of toxin-antitoxin system
MRVLIDTHIFLWFLLEPYRIRKSAREFLDDTLNNEIFISDVSAWEISIKYGVKKLSIPDIPEIWFPNRVRRAGFLHLPIELSHTLSIHNLPPHHKDPFDRLLISQSNQENLPIVTEDPKFLNYQVKILGLKDL